MPGSRPTARAMRVNFMGWFLKSCLSRRAWARADRGTALDGDALRNTCRIASRAVSGLPTHTLEAFPCRWAQWRLSSAAGEGLRSVTVAGAAQVFHLLPVTSNENGRTL